MSLIFISVNEWFLIYFLEQCSIFSKLNQVRRFSLKCTRPIFILVRRLNSSPMFVPFRGLYQSDICKSDICTVRPLFSPTFVPSDVCTSTNNCIEQSFSEKKKHKIDGKWTIILRTNKIIFFEWLKWNKISRSQMMNERNQNIAELNYL